MDSKLLLLVGLALACVDNVKCEDLHGLSSLRGEHQTFSGIRYGGLIRQKFTSTCGAASLAQILRIYDPHIASETPVLDAVKKQFPGADLRTGISLQQLVRTAQALAPGLKVSAIVCTAEMLLDCRDPVLILTETSGMGHYMVFYGIKDRNVRLADPQFGWRTVSTAKFKKMFSGYAIAIFPK